MTPERLAEIEKAAQYSRSVTGPETFTDAMLELIAALRETQAELTALRISVIELATKHGIPPDDLYAAIGQHA